MLYGSLIPAIGEDSVCKRAVSVSENIRTAIRRVDGSFRASKREVR